MTAARRLAGKTAVVTGASGGIGSATSRLFCEHGASVIGADLAEEPGRELEGELRAAGLDFAFLPVDVTSAESVATLAEGVASRFDGLDVLVNAAGVILGKPLGETTDDEWDLVLAVNLRGAFYVMRALVPLMHGRAASIVNMASGLGLVAEPNLGAYCASKGGLVQLTRSAALELGPDIRVNALCPGVIDTPMPRRAMEGLPEDVASELFRSWEEMHVAGRLGRPEEVAAAALFLAGDESSFITGAAIPVDSGVTAR